jgi:DNA-binding NarL/FixJ family response regulator
MMSTPTRVVVIDDHTSIREAAEGGRWPGLVLVASYPHTEAFLSRHRGRADYDVIVLDLQLNPQPGQSGPPPAIGTAAIRSLRNAGHHPVVLYTGIIADAVIAACLEAGADGAASKNSPNAEISRVVADVGRGHLAVDRALAGALKRLDAGRHAGGLSVQQGRVITLLAQGLNQDAIAAIIGVSTRKSVENYLRDAIFKLSQPEWDLPTGGVTGSLAARRAAAALGLSDGLVRLEDLEEARRERARAERAMPPGGARGISS